MDIDEKACPECAETVKSAAKVCRHCGYNFVSGNSGGRMPTDKPKRSILKTTFLVLGGLLLLILIIGAISGDPNDETVAPGGADQSASEAANVASEPPLKVTAGQLYSAYAANEAAAQEQYGSRPLEVSGKVDSIDLDFSDNPDVLLATGNEYETARASLTEASRPRAASLSKGQAITLLCQDVGEVIGTPMLKDCDIL